MITSLLLMLASAAFDSSPSPLTEPGYQPVWVKVLSEDDGDTWYDEKWRGSVLHQGDNLPTILLRLNGEDDNEIVRMDLIIAADCKQETLGIVKAWITESAFGDNMPAPVDELVMDFAAQPLSSEDRVILSLACQDGPQ